MNHTLKTTLIFAAGPGEGTMHVASTGITVGIDILCFWILNWHSVLLLPAPHICTLGGGFGSQVIEVVLLFVTVPGDRIQEWVHNNTVLSLWGRTSYGKQRVWITLHFFELKVSQQFCQLSRRQTKLNTSYKDTICSTEISSTFQWYLSAR